MRKFKAILAIVLIAAIAAIAGSNVLRATGTNLINNPSVETASGNQPTSWSTFKTGVNTTIFNYLNTGHTGNRSLRVQMNQRITGQAEWVFSPVAVAANTKYTFTDWYQSNVQSTYAVIVTKSGGLASTFTTLNLPASAAWKQGSLTFTTPANSTSVTVRHYINRNGQLTTDDFGLEGTAAAVPPAVSLTAPAANWGLPVI